MRQKNNEEFLIEYKRALRHTFRQIERYASLFSNQNGSQISYRTIRYPLEAMVQVQELDGERYRVGNAQTTSESQ